MQLLNLGCGAVRPPPPFINLDSLHSLLPVGSPERDQLNSEQNYVEHDLHNPLPFQEGQFGGVLLSHLLEHFDALSGTILLKDCHRVLEPGGIIMVSVPDASYHRKMFPNDNKKNCMKLFGEKMPDTESKQTFLEYALFFTDHRMIFTEDSLWATLVNAGFRNDGTWKMSAQENTSTNLVISMMHEQLNRRMFSLVMAATK